MTDDTSTPSQEERLESVRAQVRDWIADDPDPATRDELLEQLRVADTQENDPTNAHVAALLDLEDRFSGTLRFGTAGLRGAVGGGPNRMNRAVVLRAAAGLVAFLDEHVGPGRPPRVVVGYDARHGSLDFARDTVAVATAAGHEALLLAHPLPTPVLAFAVRHLDADAGVMVTASHNPAADNGYKVYLGGRVVTDAGSGAQIVPPQDSRIAAHIDAVPSVASIARAEHGWTVVGPELLEAYLASVARLADDSAPHRLTVVATPLHGVGGAVLEQVLRRAGYADVFVVPEQADPDPDFPTVAFPNPEEAGAIDLSLVYAQTQHADLVIANDPDADRCAVAVIDPGSVRQLPTNTGRDTAAYAGWRMLHGDEVGALLGELVAARAQREGAGGTLASSVVSSRLLGRIAAAHGLEHTTTLTGFKWISRVPGLVFGYEEALGYCVDPQSVRDKDGISAALLVVQLADHLKAQGRSLIDALDDLAREHGLHVSDQLSARFTDLTEIPRTMARLRQAPPTSLAGSAVVETVDLADGVDGLPPTDGLRILAQDGTRVIVRPSGTEPKVKCYLEVVRDVAPDATAEDLAEARAAARATLAAVSADMRGALGL